MRKTYLITAILLLSAVWAVAQTSPSSPQSTSPSSTSPSSTSPSQQSTTPDTTTQTTTTQTTQTSTDSSNSIEGCLSGSSGNWTLTDQSGKTWQLAGDTSKLSDHVGHQIRVTGSSDNSGSASGSMGGSSSSPSSGSSASGSASGSGSSTSGAGSSSGSTFTVKKVKMISSTCSTSK